MNARILLIEDDPVSRDLLASLLSFKGYEVDSAADGFNGLRLAQDNVYDLVLVDYHLPEMDGYAFARLMRSLAERTGRPLNMVAITADQFGLAARRGTDTIFNKLLAKPIDPDTLYECVASFAGIGDDEVENDDAISEFLNEPTAPDRQSASQLLWRARGLPCLPTAIIFPEPTAAGPQGLSYCFSTRKPETADCIVVLNEAGLEQLAALREKGTRYLLPVLGISENLRPACDSIFNIGESESWTGAARMIKNVQLRTVLLKNEIRMSNDIEMRILAYLFVSERPIRLCRDNSGQTTVSQTAGFDPNTVIASLKKLAAKGLITSRAGAGLPDGSKELEVLPNDRGLACILDGRMSRNLSNAN
jgi:CheY-like chemotaxis protein